jgi:type VI secretion system secreted protein VgrG
MSRTTLERDEHGKFGSHRGQTDRRHTFVLRQLVLEHRYHDDEPVQGAQVIVTWPNGFEQSTTLDANGRATVLGAPGGMVRVTYGPDEREFRRVDDEKNPDHRPSTSESDIDALIAKYWR